MNALKSTPDLSKRRLCGLVSTAVWATPVIMAVSLPAHAQTSMCMVDATVGGPLAGNSTGATTCQAACEGEANLQNAELCGVRESTTANGTDCACDLDLPG